MKKITLVLSVLLMTLVFQANAQTKKTGQVKKTSTVKAKKPVATKPVQATTISTTTPPADRKPVAPASGKKAAKVASGSEYYKTAIGIKFLYGISLTGKLFLKEKHALEAVIRYRNYTDLGSELNLTALYEYHENIPGVNGLRWYVGGGAYAGTFSYDNADVDPTTNYGIAGTIGLEYKIKNIPLAISADWQPVYLFNDNAGFTAENGGLGIKYTF